MRCWAEDLAIVSTASSGGGWLVRVARFGGSGVAVWQRRARTLEELRARLDEAAAVRLNSTSVASAE